MLAALTRAAQTGTLAPPTKLKTRKARRQGKSRKARINVDIDTCVITYITPKAILAKLAPGELNDDISDLFQDLPSAPLTPAVPAIDLSSADDYYKSDLFLKLFAKVDAQRKLDSAARRREKAEARKAAGLPLRDPAKLKIVTGRNIPSKIRGRVAVTGTINAKTGEALVIEVKFRNTVYRDIIVWSGAAQPIVKKSAGGKAALDLVIDQPANDRFRPSVRIAA